MADIIKLLPDSIANQIAAGEVIQRPASAVKELLENALDANATKIELVITDSGRTLIQTTDNGKGMSPADARMSLERHATSKITSADDLFAIKSKGFRGEALASIAAVSQMEMKSRERSSDVGTELIVEASKVKRQEMCAMNPGTIIKIKNLFFNVPARRKFLKSDNVELRHIIDEFERVALAHPDVEFKLMHNESELFHLPPANVRQRVIGIFGKNFNERLVPVEEDTEIVRLRGFVGKPENARKTRGEQFLFVNDRFIKSSYFHNAISKAFDGLIPASHHPSYFLFLQVDPASIDINIHPTKTEIKFEDERSVYAILRSAVKHALGQYNVAPSLDFQREQSFDIMPDASRPLVEPKIEVDPDFNPFSSEQGAHAQRAKHQDSNLHKWETLYAGLEASANPATSEIEFETRNIGDPRVRQLHKKYILIESEEGYFILHQQRAHQRVLFEEFESKIQTGAAANQQQLFPITIDLSPQDSSILSSSLQWLKNIGFDIEEFGKHTFIVRGIPISCEHTNVESTILRYIEDIREDTPSDTDKFRSKVCQVLASNSSVTAGQSLKESEMVELFRNLMTCSNPTVDSRGNSTLIRLNPPLLDKIFG